jgi:hypothetical protein
MDMIDIRKKKGRAGMEDKCLGSVWQGKMAAGAENNSQPTIK